MNNDITIYLHIGATKTGTTAIQRFLEQHSTDLHQKHHMLYPNFYDADVSAEMRPGVNYWHGRYFESSDASKDIDLFQKCIDSCKKHSLRGMIISYEGLLTKWPDRMGKLSEKLKENFKIVCYVRRQDHHLESAWKQVGHKFCSSKELLYHREGWGGWRRTNWYEQLEVWAKYFGKENIIVRPYEKEQMPKGIFYDFLESIGIKWEGEADLLRKANVNSGFSRDIMEFLYLNKDFYLDHRDQRLYTMLTALLDREYIKKPFDSYNILSPHDRIELLQQHELSNQKVAREYLHREDGRLFYEPWPNLDDPWEEYEGLTVEKMIPIVTALIYGLYQNQKALEHKIHATISSSTSTPSISSRILSFIRGILRNK
jgi:hypothetical protein